MTAPESEPATVGGASRVRKAAIVLVVAAAFAGLMLGRVVGGTNAPPGEPSAGAQEGTTITSVRNDATADYDKALAAGKPVYVLFHSLTCQPCVEISEVADSVLPDYEGRITFVNAITDDASAQKLASRFSFQYIPTSFFLAPDGTVRDSFTGAMDAMQMREYLDALVGAR